MNMEKRSIVKAIIFTIITFGIYGCYWFYKETNEVHELLGRQNSASGGWALVYSIITIGIYALYWNYKMGEAVAEALDDRNMRNGGNEGQIYLVLAIFGFGIISSCLIQDKVNDMIEHDGR